MSVSTLVASFLEEEASTASTSPLPAEIAQLIADHTANLLDVVRALGESLTSEDDVRRGRGAACSCKSSKKRRHQELKRECLSSG